MQCEVDAHNEVVDGLSSLAQQICGRGQDTRVMAHVQQLDTRYTGLLHSVRVGSHAPQCNAAPRPAPPRYAPPRYTRYTGLLHSVRVGSHAPQCKAAPCPAPLHTAPLHALHGPAAQRQGGFTRPAMQSRALPRPATHRPATHATRACCTASGWVHTPRSAAPRPAFNYVLFLHMLVNQLH